jgi:hypothetical protein
MIGQSCSYVVHTIFNEYHSSLQVSALVKNTHANEHSLKINRIVRNSCTLSAF